MSSPSLEQTYRDYIAAINARDFDRVSDYVNTKAKHNSREMSNTGYAMYVKESLVPFEENMIFNIDHLVVDNVKEQVACRIRFIRGREGEETFYEHVFYQFRNGKISEVWSVVEWPKAPARRSFEQTYMRYLSYINARCFDKLGDYVHVEVKLNGTAFSLSQYTDLIKSFLEAYGDASRFDIEDLVVNVEEEKVACRLVLAPGDAGKEKVRDHVFYYFRDGKICEVWSKN